MASLIQAFERIEAFRDAALAETVAQVETDFIGCTRGSAATRLTGSKIDADLLLSALLVKKASNQVSEIIHTIGIVLALPNLLEDQERVESLSLAAGNTGKGFDLETDRRIAEFTFIQWQGGSEVIRQNKIFKDFYFLAEQSTVKRKELYTLGLEYPKKFFSSKREIAPILGNNNKLGKSFREKYSNQYVYVRDYYLAHNNNVSLIDVCNYIPCLRSLS